MNKITITAILVLTSNLIFGCATSSIKIKEVIEKDKDSGKERYWVLKQANLIVEEHCFTVHGDFHLSIEYPKGVSRPQLNLEDAERDNGIEARYSVYWPNGKLMNRIDLIDNIPSGRYQWWYPNGILGKEGEWREKMPFGEWKVYDSSGKLIAQGYFKNGKRQNGTFIGDENSAGFFFYGDDPKIETYENGEKTKEEKINISFSFEEK